MSNLDKYEKLEAFTVVLIYFASFIFGAGIVLWQCFNWLKSSTWIPMPTSIAFEFFRIDISSIYNPTEWLGLAKIVQWLLNLPLAITGPVVAILSINYLASISVAQRKKWNNDNH